MALQDPYCAWDKTRHKCIIQQGAWSGGGGEGGGGSVAKSELIQSVSDGVHPDCGKPKKKTNEKPSHQQAASVDNWDTGSGTPPPDHPHSDAGEETRICRSVGREEDDRLRTSVSSASTRPLSTLSSIHLTILNPLYYPELSTVTMSVFTALKNDILDSYTLPIKSTYLYPC